MDLKIAERYDLGPSVYQHDGHWYWKDEGYEENGPCTSETEAIKMQSEYASKLMYWVYNEFKLLDE